MLRLPPIITATAVRRASSKLMPFIPVPKNAALVPENIQTIELFPHITQKFELQAVATAVQKAGYHPHDFEISTATALATIRTEMAGVIRCNGTITEESHVRLVEYKGEYPTGNEKEESMSSFTKKGDLLSFSVSHHVLVHGEHTVALDETAKESLDKWASKLSTDHSKLTDSTKTNFPLSAEERKAIEANLSKEAIAFAKNKVNGREETTTATIRNEEEPLFEHDRVIERRWFFEGNLSIAESELKLLMLLFPVVFYKQKNSDATVIVNRRTGETIALLTKQAPSYSAHPIKGVSPHPVILHGIFLMAATLFFLVTQVEVGTSTRNSTTFFHEKNHPINREVTCEKNDVSRKSPRLS